MSYRPGDSLARDGLGAVFAVIFCLFVVALIVVGGWQAGWWFTTENTNRQAQLDRSGIGYQAPLTQQIGADIGTVRKLNTRIVAAHNDPDLLSQYVPQRHSVVSEICGKAAELTGAVPLSGEQSKFVSANCSAGAVSPTSVYN